MIVWTIVELAGPNVGFVVGIAVGIDVGIAVGADKVCEKHLTKSKRTKHFGRFLVARSIDVVFVLLQ